MPTSHSYWQVLGLLRHLGGSGAEECLFTCKWYSMTVHLENSDSIILSNKWPVHSSIKSYNIAYYSHLLLVFCAN